MNAATATQRIQATCALSIALLASGMTAVSHRAEPPIGSLHHDGYERLARGALGCVNSHRPQAVFAQDAHQTVATCNGTSGSTASSSVRLTKPLSGAGHIYADENIRYSF